MRVVLREAEGGEVLTELQLADAPRAGEFLHWGPPEGRRHEQVVQVHWVDGEPDAVFVHVAPIAGGARGEGGRRRKSGARGSRRR